MMTPDARLFQVEGQPDHAARKLDHFTGHDARQAVDPRNTVAYFQNASHVADVDLRVVLFNFRLQNGSYLVGFEFHERSC